ncbi:MAG: hypothetical protein KGD65_07710 [Candidatus Lokiarchaeota archaeon]|nr:hypothetical protein [Candidatus Lokiarchaeota archaeon]
MFYTIADDLIFYQLISYKKKYSNFEIKLHNYFHVKSGGIYPDFIVVIRQFIFFFVKNEYYFASKHHLDSMRRGMKSKKIIIIRTESVLINLLFSLFPDVYIHDIAFEVDETSNQREISIYFLTFKERGIAIGRGGEYIKCINELFKNFIRFNNKEKPIDIKCRNLFD